MTKGEAVRIVEVWVAAFNSETPNAVADAYAEPPIASIKRLLQEVKSSARSA